MVGRAVAAVASPALGASVPGVAVMSGVIRCARTPACGTTAPEGAAPPDGALVLDGAGFGVPEPAPPAGPEPAVPGAPDGAGRSTRICTWAVPASSQSPSL